MSVVGSPLKLGRDGSARRMLMVLVSVMLSSSPEVQVSHRRVTSSDGAVLALYRYRLQAHESERTPVLLVPDLGFSRAAWDFEGRGLARWLASRGLTVYVAELRGQGKAGPGLSLGAMAERDLPAVLSAIGAPLVDVVVQGWAGSAILAATSNETRIRRVVAFNTPLLAEVPSELAGAFLERGGRFSTLAGSPDGARTFELLFALWARLPTRTMNAFLATGTRDLSRPVAAELLAWMRQGDLPLPDGSSVVARLTQWRRPTLLLVGLADGFASPELCAVWRERVPAGVITLRSFSRLETDDDFSHLSMLLGSKAPVHVFPRVAAFLEAP